MAIGRPISDLSKEFNSVYKITQDVSGWDEVTVQAIGPMIGQINFQGSNDNGETNYMSGNAELAINFSTIQATNLATGTAVTSIYGPGLYRVDVNAQFLRLQGAPAGTPTSIYRLLLFNSKV